LFLACLFLVAHPAQALAAGSTTTYTATETIPVPPASNYASSGGGDGWAVALSSTQVFNVFHHQSTLVVACHNQSDGSDCWSPETIKDGSGDNFATSGQPGMYLNQTSGKLWVYATRTSDGTAGAVCIDTAQAAASTDPFCGFVALTPAGQGPLDPAGISGLSGPMQVGNRLYSFNYVNGQNVSGAENELLCFDVSTDQACAGQPFAVNIGPGNVSDSGFPSPATAAIADQIIIPLNINGGSRLACFDDSTHSACAGSWPVTLSFTYPSVDGSPYPMLDSTGHLTGFCLPTGVDQCYAPTGSSLSTPTGMSGVIGGSSPWNGPAFVLGPRVYVPNGNANQVQCFDYATDASCASFPKSFNNLGYLYTVNADPERPTCIWVNADNGSAQIQNFDAYTAGGCGQGPIRVLASSLVVPQPVCVPNSYVSLQVLAPPPSTYTSGTVTFEDPDGNQIAGTPVETLDSSGTVNLTGLNLNTAQGLPEFLITLTGASTTPTSVQVQLTWIGVSDPSCVPSGMGMSGPVAGFGDSVAAGYGLSSAAEWNGNFLASRFPGGDTGCDLTPPAYPCVLADSANGTLDGSDNYSIQGASSGDVLGTELPLAEKNAAAKRALVRTVTVTVGADDIHFSECLSDEFQFKTDHCISGSINGGLRLSTSTAQHLSHLASNLQRNFTRIHSGFPNASIVVTGYYQPFPPPAPAGSDACGVFAVPALAALQTQQGIGLAAILTYLRNLPQFELEFQTRFYIVASFLERQLNHAIQNAANIAFNAGLPVSYVDIGPVFDGHDLCARDQAWIEAPRLIANIAGVINIDSTFGTPKCEYPAPPVVGSEVNKTIFNSSVGFAIFHSNCIPHPIARGQEAIADAIQSG
jgi:GDSL-like Lipase/Acylhydrolase family